MRDTINTGIHNQLRIEGNNNVIQQRIEKKDKTETPPEPEPSDGRVATQAPSDTATRVATIYEKPYQIPFSNLSPQMPERAIGTQLGQGTGVADIRPMKTDVSALQNTPVKTDRIDEPTTIQDFVKSYEKTPLPDTTIPTKPIPEPSGAFVPQLEPDALYPAQTEKEYEESEIPATPRPKYGEPRYKITQKGKKLELRDRDGNFLRYMKMSKTGDKKIFEEVFGEPYQKGQSPSKGKFQGI